MGMNEKGESRRAFLRNSGAALLAGYAFTNRTGLAQTVAKPDASKYQSFTLRTHDYDPHGEQEERLDFPKDWKVDVIHMAGVKNTPLTPAQIVERLRQPIGSKSLRDIASGKKTAAVTFDDLTRPTPVHLVAEHVVNELNAAGIDDDHILFIGACGSHQDISAIDAAGKLGPVFWRCPWTTHNVHNNHVTCGRTSWNNMIEVNGYWARSDVKVLIGAIRNHGGYGYSGGPKSIIPGITSLKTIFYNHCVVGGINKGNTSYEGTSRGTSGPGMVINNDRRLDAVEAARLAGTDFSVNIVQNGSRQVIGLFCGDVNEAHLEACRMADKTLAYESNPKGADYDICITNGYPASRYSGIQFGSVKEGGISIAVRQSPNGGHFHHLHETGEWDNKSWWETRYNPRAAKFRRIILSQYQGKDQYINMQGVERMPSWDKILPILEQTYKSGARVLFYPYGNVAHAPGMKRTLYPEDVVAPAAAPGGAGGQRGAAPAGAAPAGGAPAGGAPAGGARPAAPQGGAR